MTCRVNRPLVVEQAKRYFAQELSKGDYYAKDGQEQCGRWSGKGAELIGLSGTIKRDSFFSLLDGKDPHTGERLVESEAKSGKRRAAWDCTASPEKDVSILALIGGDRRLIEAHRIANDRALQEVQNLVASRNTQRVPMPTGNAIIASFDHETSRSLDPQLHTHNLILNMTKREDGQWRAIDSRTMFRGNALFKATYHAELTREVQKLGYTVTHNAKGELRIDGVTDELRDVFSKRRKEVEQNLRERGESGAQAAEDAALRTRKGKQKDIDTADLVDDWQRQVSKTGVSLNHIVHDAYERSKEARTDSDRAIQQANMGVSDAIDHLSERQAVFSQQDLEVQSLRFANHGVTLDEVRGAIQANPRLISSNGKLTTADAVALEEEVNTLAMDVRNHRSQVVQTVDFEGSREKLNARQSEAATSILTSKDGLLALEGKAGTGKTTMLKEVQRQAQQHGWSIRGFGPSNTAASELKAAGIDAQTIASLASSQPKGPSGKQLWFVDEAGLQSSSDARIVLAQAKACGAKVVLIGDQEQHHAVAAGSPFRYLKDAGVQVIRLDEIVRQKDVDLKRAVEAASSGQMETSISLLARKQCVVEAKSKAERHRAIAMEYVHTREKGSVLVVAPSNVERQDLNHLIRKELISANVVAPSSLEVDARVAKGITDAQKRHASSYSQGDQVTFYSRSVAGKPGATGRVVASDITRNLVTVELPDSRQVTFNPRQFVPDHLDVAEVQRRRFSEGDRIQFRYNDKDKGISNGDVGTIQALDLGTGKALVGVGEEGKKLRTVEVDLKGGGRPLALDYGYAVTSHSSQGKTVDSVLIALDTERAGELVNTQMFYVALSRARYEAKLFTNSIPDLREAVSTRAAEKSRALSLVDAASTRITSSDRPNLAFLQGLYSKIETRLKETIPQKAPQVGKSSRGDRHLSFPDLFGEDPLRMGGEAARRQPESFIPDRDRAKQNLREAKAARREAFAELKQMRLERDVLLDGAQWGQVTEAQFKLKAAFQDLNADMENASKRKRRSIWLEAKPEIERLKTEIKKLKDAQGASRAEYDARELDLQERIYAASIREINASHQLIGNAWGAEHLASLKEADKRFAENAAKLAENLQRRFYRRKSAAWVDSVGQAKDGFRHGSAALWEAGLGSFDVLKNQSTRLRDLAQKAHAALKNGSPSAWASFRLAARQTIGQLRVDLSKTWESAKREIDQGRERLDWWSERTRARSVQLRVNRLISENRAERTLTTFEKTPPHKTTSMKEKADGSSDDRRR